MYSAFSTDIPNLTEVEKKAKSCIYNTIHMFALDIRKIWKYYFSYGNNPETYQKTYDISQCFEEIMAESEDHNAEEQSIEQMNRKMKEVEDRMIKQDKLKNSQIQPFYDNKPIIRPSVPLQEKPMTITEKNILGNKIRMLSQDQMKGIINILSDHCPVDNNSKYFEFDIETLSTKKLRDLEKYVKKCIKVNVTSQTPKQVVQSKIEKPDANLLNNLKAGLSHKPHVSLSTPVIPTPIKPNLSEIQPKQQITSTNIGQKPIVPQPKLQPPKYGNDHFDSLSSSEDNDSGSLSSLDFKKR